MAIFSADSKRFLRRIDLPLLLAAAAIVIIRRQEIIRGGGKVNAH